MQHHHNVILLPCLHNTSPPPNIYIQNRYPHPHTAPGPTHIHQRDKFVCLLLTQDDELQVDKHGLPDAIVRKAAVRATVLPADALERERRSLGQMGRSVQRILQQIQQNITQRIYLRRRRPGTLPAHIPFGSS